MVAVHSRVHWEISMRVPCLRAISLISSNSCIRIRIMKVCTRIFRYSSRRSWRAVAICFSWVSYTFCERCCSITRFCCRLDSVIGPRFGWLVGWRVLTARSVSVAGVVAVVSFAIGNWYWSKLFSSHFVQSRKACGTQFRGTVRRT